MTVEWRPVRMFRDSSLDCAEHHDEPGPSTATRQAETTITFGTLRDQYLDDLKARSEDDGSSDPARNAKWAIKKWFLLFGVNDSDDVPANWRSAEEFENLLKQMQEAQKAASIQTLRNLATEMRRWRDYYEILLLKSELPDDFVQCLAVLCERNGISKNSLAKQVGIPSATIFGWTSWRRLPGRHSRKNILPKIERFFSLPPGTLRDRLTERPRDSRSYRNSFSNGTYSKRLNIIQKQSLGYRMNQLPLQIETSVDALIAYRSSMEFLNGKEIIELGPPWAEASIQHIRKEIWNFFSFLVLPQEADTPYMQGMGIGCDELTFAMLVDPDKCRAFCEFLRKRCEIGSDRKIAGYPLSALHFLQLSLSLLHKERGFVRNCPQHLGIELSAMNSEKRWQKWCAERKELLKIHRSIINKQIVKTREQPNIESITRLEDPLSVPDGLLDQMKRNIPATTSPITKARHYRDIVLITLLRHAPVRRKNLFYARIGTNLVKREGVWILQFAPEELKNGRSRAGKNGYSRKLPTEAGFWIEEYLDKYRPKLLENVKEETDRLFVTRNGPYKSPPALSQTVACITWSFLGIKLRSHAFRKVLPTAILKKHPENYAAAAAWIGDTEETLRMAYDDTTQQDHLRHVDEFEKTRALQQEEPKTHEALLQRIKDLEEENKKLKRAVTSDTKKKKER